jgi:DNA-binding response OmpR family regulator
MKILLIEDEIGIASFIAEGLGMDNYLVDIAYEGYQGLDQAVVNDYDLIILDLMLPDIDGITICQEIRKNKITTPILMLTAKNTTEDKIIGLDAGADDYLAKPFDLNELLARVRAMLRREGRSLTSEILRVANLEMNTKTHEVKRAGKKIELSNKEFKLLDYFMRHANEVITRQQILDHVWESDIDPFSNTVEVHIRFLRQKIDQNFPKKLIKTIRGSGYKISE